MDRLLSFWQKYRPQVDPLALQFLREVCQVMAYKKQHIIKLPDQSLPYFYIVLDGVVCGFETNGGRDPSLREIILALDYFSGTLHPFSRSNRQIEYRTLTPVILLQMTIAQAVHSQQHYPDLAELFQVMKQRKINQLRHQVAIFQEKTLYRRYCLYRQFLPDWAILLPHHTQYQFLQISKAHYKRLKAIWLRNPDKRYKY